MDVMTFIGWTLLVWAAYKVGVYLEGKMKAKAQEREARAEADADPERKQ